MPSPEEQLMHQMVVLPFRGTLAGWRKGVTAILCVQQREMQGAAPGLGSLRVPARAGG